MLYSRPESRVQLHFSKLYKMSHILTMRTLPSHAQT